MKKVLLILITLISIISCKKEAKDFTNDPNYKTLNGEFLLYDNAAVLQTPSEIYGVVLDDTAKELNKKCSAYKNEVHDMATVLVKGLVSPNPNKDGWANVVAIKEIVRVSASKQKTETIKIVGSEEK